MNPKESQREKPSLRSINDRTSLKYKQRAITTLIICMQARIIEPYPPSPLIPSLPPPSLITHSKLISTSFSFPKSSSSSAQGLLPLPDATTPAPTPTAAPTPTPAPTALYEGVVAAERPRGGRSAATEVDELAHSLLLLLPWLLCECLCGELSKDIVTCEESLVGA
jgi:hypothetical protein